MGATDEGEEPSWPEHPATADEQAGHDPAPGAPPGPRAPAWVERLVQRQRGSDVPHSFGPTVDRLHEWRAKATAVILFAALFAGFVAVMVVFVLRVTGRV